MLKLPIKKGAKVWGIMGDGRVFDWIWTGSIYDMQDYKFLGLYRTRDEAKKAVARIRKFIWK